MRRSTLLLLSMMAVFTPIPTTNAAEPSQQERATARALGDEGILLWEKADYAGALDRFTRALALVDAPTLSLRQAECLQKLGRWVEALGKLQTLARLELSTDAPAPFLAAVRTARQQEADLQKRMPMLVVEVEGNPADTAVLTVDDSPLESPLWGTERPVDPGTRAVRLISGKHRVDQTVTVREGEVKRVVLRLPDAPEGDSSAPSSAWNGRTLGWVGVGVGTAGVVAGGVMWSMARSKQSDLDDAGCSGGRCPQDLKGDLDSYDKLRTGSYLGLGLGALALIGGGTLLLSDPGRAQEPAVARVQPWIGLGEAGVAGSF